MKLSFFILFPILVFGQVGINKPSPKASLDIYGFPDDPSKSSGFIAPRLTLSQLNSKLGLYNNETVGAILYITTIDLSLPYANALRYVATPGYYFYNGQYWEPFESRTGYNVLKASITGNGSTVQTIPSNIYTVIDLTVTHQPLGGWDENKNTYKIPISGVYLILADIELTSDVNTPRSIYLAVNNDNNKTEVMEGTWKYNPTGRFTFPYTRLGYFSKDTELVYYSFSLDYDLQIAGAQLNITLLKPIEN